MCPKAPFHPIRFGKKYSLPGLLLSRSLPIQSFLAFEILEFPVRVAERSTTSHLEALFQKNRTRFVGVREPPNYFRFLALRSGGEIGNGLDPCVVGNGAKSPQILFK